jgi:hypothetical protein
MNFGDDAIGRAVEASFRANKAGVAPGSHKNRADPYDVRQHQADQVGDARDPDVWKPVMTYFDFHWFEPAHLTARVGPIRYTPSDLPDVLDQYGRPVKIEGIHLEKPHEVGQWRNDLQSDSWRVPEQLKMAFTHHDLATLYRTPEQFYDFFMGQIRRLRAQRAGLVLPR